jgi:hypothetical protein
MAGNGRLADLGRRIESLPREVEAWRQAAGRNTGGAGIHAKQLEAIQLMMDERIAKERSLLSALQAVADPVARAEQVLALAEDIAHVREVWNIFARALQQRLDPSLKPILDAADLVAADCYLRCIDRLVEVRALAPHERRPSPLVVLEAKPFPLTVNRGEQLGRLGIPLHDYAALRLTVPVVLFPADEIDSLWSFCGIHHEVGHSITQELDLERELKQAVYAQLDELKVDGARVNSWWSWTGEIIADTFGVLFGGVGFVLSLLGTLQLIAAAGSYAKLDAHDPHPNPHLRILLLLALLEGCRVADWTAVATSARESWRAEAPAPPWLEAFVPDVPRVAGIFLRTKLGCLKRRSLSQLVPIQPRPSAAKALAAYLAQGTSRPQPRDNDITHRAVPPAAELALAGPPGDLDAVQQRGMRYLLDDVPRRTPLAPPGPTDQRYREFLRGIARAIRFPQGDRHVEQVSSPGQI